MILRGRFFTLLIVVAAFFCCADSLAQLKVLHISFHKGCINDFEVVSRELGSLDLTSWFVLESADSKKRFDAQACGNDIYNINHDRAERVWQQNKDYFNTFDMIVTSDTAPISRIFLQQNWRKPLIVWICNRFDYADWETRDGTFPDRAYYNLFQEAVFKSNVKVVAYTPYEHYYARRKGVNTGTRTIRPIGSREDEVEPIIKSFIPDHINTSETLFVYPRLNNSQLSYIQNRCADLDISTFSGVYNGPNDLQGFKGVIYFPYAWSNLALFENIQRGIVHFVPSEKFVQNLKNSGMPVNYCTLNLFPLVDWYAQEYRDLMVYFDSWNDLKQKIKMLDYEAMHKKIKQAGKRHRDGELQKWRELFLEIQ